MGSERDKQREVQRRSSLEHDVRPSEDERGSREPGAFSRLLARNLRAAGLAELAGRFLGFAIIIVLARRLSEADFGRYTVAVALVGLLSALAEFGTSAYLVREGAQKPETLGRTLGRVLVIRALLGLAAVGVVAALALGAAYDDTTLVVLALLTVAAILRLLGSAFLTVLQSLERLADVAAVQMQQTVVTAVTVIVVAFLGGSLVEIVIATVVPSFLSPIWSWWRLRRVWRDAVRISLVGVHEMLLPLAAFSFAAGFGIAITYVDSLIVNAYQGNEATAQYGAAYRLLIAAYMVPIIYNQAANRAIAQFAAEDKQQLQNIHARSVVYLSMTAVPLAVGGAALSPLMMEILYGPSYKAAGVTLALLLASNLFTFPGWIIVTSAYALRLERVTVWIFMLALAFNVAGNLVAVPAWSIEGAAVVNLLTEALFLILVTLAVQRSGVRFPTGAVARLAVAGCAMAAVVAALHAAVPVIAAVVIASVVYVGALIVLHVLVREDIDLVRGLVAARARR